MKPILFSIICLLSLNLTKGQQINHFKTTDGEPLYYTSLGKGPKVILLYGGPGFGVGPMRITA